jgi:PAT family beta-lactamase induction signal transducer AmpG
MWHDRRAWIMAALGFASGLPLMLTLTTLRQWLVEQGTPLTIIGLTANIGLAYSLKFLWSPMLDHVPAPFGLHRFGRRRGWLLAVQPLLALSILGMALSQSGAQALIAASLIALFSATQDIAIDAWRIETFNRREQGLATAIYVWGYRVAMLVASGGVLKLAGIIGWRGALLGITVLALACLVATWLADEPAVDIGPRPSGGCLARIIAAIWHPLREFLRRPGGGLVLLFVLVFNLGESIAGVMLTPLYRFLGFTRDNVANISVFSLVGTLAGVAAGGWVVRRIGLGRALLVTGAAQTAAMGMYVVLAGSPGAVNLLYATVLLEAVVQGMATSAFTAYLATLCAARFTATQNALLTSLAVVASHVLGGWSGYLVDAVGFQTFYTLALACALPAMALMLIILKRFPNLGDR